MPTLPWRVQQSTTTTGTGTLALNAASSGRRGFQDAFGTGTSRIGYVISGASFFEIGYGDFDGGSPGNLTRAAVISSSNAGALVSLPTGTADVFPFIDPGERKIVTGTSSVTVALIDIGNAIVWTGTAASALNLPSVTGLPEGRGITVRNAGTAALTVTANGSDVINGSGTLVLAPTQAVELIRVGAAWAGFWEGGRIVGELVYGAMATPPPRCVWAAGQALSRTTYAALFAMIGTAFGVGDGSTTFNVPDARGRAVFGRDDMNGTAANRLTNAVSGLTGTTLGATGGDQRIPSHTHPLTDPGHAHAVTDPGHAHSTNGVQRGSGGGANYLQGGVTYDTAAASVGSATTGISVNTATTGISVGANTGSGSSANIPPAIVANVFIYTGVG